MTANDMQKSNVSPSQRGTVTTEPTTVKKVSMLKRGSVVDAPKVGTLSGLSAASRLQQLRIIVKTEQTCLFTGWML